jgi:hypothetical protein
MPQEEGRDVTRSATVVRARNDEMELAMGAQRWCTGHWGLLPQEPAPNKHRWADACWNTAAIAARETADRCGASA